MSSSGLRRGHTLTRTGGRRNASRWMAQAWPKN